MDTLLSRISLLRLEIQALKQKQAITGVKWTRVLIEQTFGLLKSRFRCLHKSGVSLQYIPQKCANIIVACLLLHNYCVKRRIPNPEMLDPDDDDDDDAHDPPVAGHLNATGQDARLEVVENFFTRPRHR